MSNKVVSLLPTLLCRAACLIEHFKHLYTGYMDLLQQSYSWFAPTSDSIEHSILRLLCRLECVDEWLWPAGNPLQEAHPLD